MPTGTTVDSTSTRSRLILPGLVLAFLLLGMVAPGQVQAVTCTTTGTNGNWTADETWDCGSAGNAGTDGIPGSGDTAEIGHAVTVDANVTVGTVNINAGGFLDPPAAGGSDTVVTLTVESGFSIKDSGSILNAVRTAGGVKSELGIDVGGGITNDGTIDFAGASSAVFEADGSLTNNSGASITTGPIRVDIRTTVTNDGTLTVSNNGTLEIGGNFTNNGDFDATSPSLVDFQGELVQGGSIQSQSLSGNFFGDDAFENVDVGGSTVVDPDDVLNQSNASNNPVEFNGSLNVVSGGAYGTGNAVDQTVSEGSDLTYSPI